MRYLILSILILLSGSVYSQNPIDKINGEVRNQLSSGSGRLGAMKSIIKEITADGTITPEDFKKVIEYQKILYNSVNDDFGIREALDPKFNLLFQEMKFHLQARWQDMHITGKEEQIKAELRKFDDILNDVAGFSIEDKTGQSLESIDVEKFTQQYDQIVKDVNVDKILELISTFLN